MIVACDENNAIGYNNELLCRLRDDMRHFVSTTKGKPVIMGYQTFLSLKAKPLPNRLNIVLTRTPMEKTLIHAEAVNTHDNLMFESLPYVEFMLQQSDKEFVVIGGEETYRLFMPSCTRIYLTRIHHDFKEADSFFPPLRKPADWRIRPLAYYPQNSQNDQAITIFQYDKE